MHVHLIEDSRGDVVDVVPFCGDSCHREYCTKHGLEYGGWNGCNEGGDSPEFCACCGVFAGGTPDCECQTNNVVVGRVPREEGEKCACGHWVQLPSKTVESL